MSFVKQPIKAVVIGYETLLLEELTKVKTMDLIATFYRETKEDYSDESVYNAIKKCDTELRKYVDLNNGETVLKFFFYKDEYGHITPNDNYQNLLDFCDMIKEFQNSITNLIYDDKNIQILFAVMVANDIYSKCVIDDIKESMSEIKKARFDMLVGYLFTIPECKTMSVTYKISSDAKAQTEYFDMEEIVEGKAMPFLKSNIELALINAFTSIGLIDIESMDNKTNKKIRQRSYTKNGQWVFIFAR